jgi:3-methyladenine DNA glycosylase Tag
MGTLRPFAKIEAMAGSHHGGAKGVAQILQDHPGDPSLLQRSDDRFLAGMTRAVFSAGFVWAVIEAKWEGFEAAFERFDPHRVAFFGDDDAARLVGDARIVRNGQKIMATIHNARFVVETARTHGSFGRFLRDWPADDQIGLMAHLKTHGARLAGATGQYFLRFNGWDAFILSQDVGAALVREGVVDKPPTSKKELAATQAAFNRWAEESGRPRREISRILALSVG